MLDDARDITEFYSSDPDREHRRLEEHQLEYDLTWRYLDKYLPPEGEVLEVGSATGRYTMELARRGYRVTAVDLSAELVGRCRKNLAGEGLESRVRLVVADARDLGEVGETRFDAALLMGPLYHLAEEGGRKAALKETFERLRAGGLIFSTLLSRFGVQGYLMRSVPHWIEDRAHVRSLMENGRRPDDYPRGGFRGYFAYPSEVAPLHEALGFETLVVAGIEPAISADDESYNRLQGGQRQLWLDLLYEISTEGSIVGASRHLLYVGKKRS